MTAGQSGIPTSDGRERLVVSVPVLFLDEQMPQLKDTELRVLLTIRRQTGVIGREVPTTWLTHTELCRRTGRASEAVSAAVEHLARTGWLEVSDERGKMLTTTAARRRARSRLFYRIRGLADVVAAPTEKAKTIEEKDKTYRFRKSDFPADREGEATPSSSEQRQRIEREKARIRERLRHLRP